MVLSFSESALLRAISSLGVLPASGFADSIFRISSWNAVAMPRLPRRDSQASSSSSSSSFSSFSSFSFSYCVLSSYAVLSIAPVLSFGCSIPVVSFFSRVSLAAGVSCVSSSLDESTRSPNRFVCAKQAFDSRGLLGRPNLEANFLDLSTAGGQHHALDLLRHKAGPLRLLAQEHARWRGEA